MITLRIDQEVHTKQEERHLVEAAAQAEEAEEAVMEPVISGSCHHSKKETQMT